MNIKTFFFRKKNTDDLDNNTRFNAGDELPENATLEEKIIAAIRTIYDPEIPVNIYDMGLIYDIKIKPGGEVEIIMTLTAPACPVAEILPAQVTELIKSIEGVRNAHVSLVWEPAWNRDFISDAAKLSLGLL